MIVPPIIQIAVSGPSDSPDTLYALTSNGRVFRKLILESKKPWEEVEPIPENTEIKF
jgi:hypothetical protein